jgi:putative phage-type endonuclease
LNRTEWLELRRTCITATDIAKVCRMSRFGSPIDVWLDKMGKTEAKDPDGRMLCGLLLEDGIAKLYEHDTKLKLSPRTGYDMFTRHPNFHWIGCTPDGLVEGESRGVDFKNLDKSMKHKFGMDYSDDIPRDYLLQNHWSMLVTGRERWDTYVLFGGNEPHCYSVFKNPETEKALLKVATDFWFNRVMKEIAPEVDDSEQYEAYLRNLYPEVERDMLDVNDEYETVALILEYFDAKDAVKDAEAKLQFVRNRIIDSIGVHEGIYCEEGVATWRKNKNGSRVFRCNRKG